MNQELIKKSIEDNIQTGPISGISVAAGKGGEILCEVAAGVANETGAVLNSGTIFDVGTMTQPLATTNIVAALCAQQNINLNTPVIKFWPDFADEGKEKVTIRQLLKHTSGLSADKPYFKELTDSHPDWVGNEKGLQFILNKIATEGLEYPPSYTMVPSNMGFIALGHVAEFMGDKPLRELFSEIVVNRLGLKNTVFNVPENWKNDCASSIFCPYRKKVLCGEVSDPNSWVIGGISGHAGLFSTPSDAAKIGMAYSLSLKHDGGFLPAKALSDLAGQKSKYKMGWETPEYTNPICGSKFSSNTIGHVSTTGASLWTDLDAEIAVAVFVTFANKEQPDLKAFAAILPTIHDVIREELK